MFDIDEVEAVDRRIQRLGSAMLFAEPVLAVGRDAGIDDAITFYAGGRGGVLGTSEWQQVHSAFGFFPPEVVQGAWGAVTAWGEPLAMAKHYADGLAAFGSAVFPTDAAKTFADLGRQVADSVTPLGYALFGGWRSMTVPPEDRAAAAVMMMTLRELRGDIHLQDIAAAGIEPVEAEIVVRGADGIPLHGWQPPYPNPDDHRSQVEDATAQTSERMRRIYEAALTETEWQSFSDAVSTLTDAQRDRAGA